MTPFSPTRTATLATPMVSPAPSCWRPLLPWLVAAMVVVFVLVVGGLAVLAASLFSGTSLTRGDFTTPAEATAFVSDHLPAALPDGADVTTLTYERFTDWHLEAAVRLPSAEAVRDYLSRARAGRTDDVEYCGPSSETSETVSYFLSQWSACGAVTAAAQDTITVRCHTR